MDSGSAGSSIRLRPSNKLSLVLHLNLIPPLFFMDIALLI